MTLRKWGCGFVVGLLATTSQVCANTPGDVVDNLHHGIVEILQSPDNQSFAWRYHAFRMLVHKTHDMQFITRLTVYRIWRDLDDTQQTELVEKLTDLSAATYASRFKTFVDQAFRITGEQDQPRDAKLVQAELQVDDRVVDFEYMLHKIDDEWVIFNIIVDGVSDLALKRAEYNGYLHNGGYQQLIEALDRQIEQARNRH